MSEYSKHTLRTQPQTQTHTQSITMAYDILAILFVYLMNNP